MPDEEEPIDSTLKVSAEEIRLVVSPSSSSSSGKRWKKERIRRRQGNQLIAMEDEDPRLDRLPPSVGRSEADANVDAEEDRHRSQFPLSGKNNPVVVTVPSRDVTTRSTDHRSRGMFPYEQQEEEEDDVAIERYTPVLDTETDHGNRHGRNAGTGQRASSSPADSSTLDASMSRSTSRTLQNNSDIPPTYTTSILDNRTTGDTATNSSPSNARRQQQQQQSISTDLERLRSGKSATRAFDPPAEGSSISSRQASHGSSSTKETKGTKLVSSEIGNVREEVPMLRSREKRNHIPTTSTSRGNRDGCGHVSTGVMHQSLARKDLQTNVREKSRHDSQPESRTPLHHIPSSSLRENSHRVMVRKDVQPADDRPSLNDSHGSTTRLPPTMNIGSKRTNSVANECVSEPGVETVLESSNLQPNRKYRDGAHGDYQDDAYVQEASHQKPTSSNKPFTNMIKKVTQRLPSPKRTSNNSSSVTAQQPRRSEAGRPSPVLVETVQSGSGSERSAAGIEIAQINANVLQPPSTIRNSAANRSESGQISTLASHQTVAVTTKNTSTRSEGQSSDNATTRASDNTSAAKSASKLTLLEDIVQKLDGDISLIHALLRREKDEKAKGESEGTAEPGFFRSFWRNAPNEAARPPTQTLPSKGPALQPPSVERSVPLNAEDNMVRTDRVGIVPAANTRVLHPYPAAGSYPMAPSSLAIVSSDDKKEVRFSSSGPLIHEISKEAESISPTDDTDRRGFRTSSKAIQAKKDSKNRGGIFAFVKRRHATTKTRKAVNSRVISMSLSDEPSEDSELSLQPETKGKKTLDRPPANDRMKRTPKTSAPTKHSPRKKITHTRGQPPPKPGESIRHHAPMVGVQPCNSNTFKSPAVRRREQTARGTAAKADTASTVRSTSHLLKVSMDDSEIPTPGTSDASMDSTTESSVQILDSALELSNRPGDTAGNAYSGDLMSCLFPGLFCATPIQPTIRQTETRRPAIAPEDNSMPRSSTKSFIPDAQWHDILNATEVLAIQYRESEKMGDAEVPVSERTITEVNRAIATFKKHAYKLGIHEQQLMEAIRDDIRDIHEIKSSRATKASGKDKFLEMYDYYFAANK
jgi:hypothetical protein